MSDASCDRKERLIFLRLECRPFVPTGDSVIQPLKEIAEDKGKRTRGEDRGFTREETSR